jgi:hypothetical protein
MVGFMRLPPHTPMCAIRPITCRKEGGRGRTSGALFRIAPPHQPALLQAIPRGSCSLCCKVSAPAPGWTRWPEMYMLRGGAPFRRDSNGCVYDKRGEQIDLLGASLAILEELASDPKWASTQVVRCMDASCDKQCHRVLSMQDAHAEQHFAGK